MVIARRLVIAAALIGLVASAGWVLDRVYSGDLLLRLVLGAAVGAVAVTLLARRLPAWTVAPLSVAALAGYSVAATAVSAKAAGIDGRPVALAVDALRDAIPRLLSALVPVEPQPDTVLVPVLATWLAGLAAAELALRAGRGLAACAPLVILYAAALALAGPQGSAAFGSSLAFVGCAAALLTATTDRTAAPATLGGVGPALRTVGGAVAALAVVVALTAAAGPLVARRVDRAPTDPRRHVVPPHVDALDENPLSRLSGWALTPDRHLLDADVPGAPDPVRIRLAVLGDYDGVTWRVGGSYRVAGRDLPDPVRPGEGVSLRTQRQQFTIADLDGRLLPAAATPRRVDGVRVAYDAASGTIVLPDGLHNGVSYSVRSEVSTVDVNVLPGLDAPAGPSVARFLELGSAVPPDMGRLANQLGEGSAAPYDRALAIEQFLSEHYDLVGDGPSGHAYPNLSFFLFGPREGGGQKGTTEQFAAAFAVLGRILGLPTRVVLGFIARPGGRSVRARDAFAWPEVLFKQVGWVPFNPLPPSDSKARPVEDDFKPPPPPPPAPPPSSIAPPSISPAPSEPSAGGDASAGGQAPDNGALGVVFGVLGAAALVCGYLVAVPMLRRRLRDRRLSSGSPAERIAGAWREVLDALRLAGRPAPEHFAVTEIAVHGSWAVHGARHVRAAVPTHAGASPAAGSGVALLTNAPFGPDPADPLCDLGGLANAAAFGPHELTAADADRAARLARSYVDNLRRTGSTWRQIEWTLDPRPLWWSRH